MIHDRRRTMLRAGFAVAAMPPLAWAQPSSPKRLAWLSGGWPDDPGFKASIDTVISTLHDKGWVRGENYVIEFRFVDGDASRYPAMADELIAWGPDVLYGLETAAKVLVRSAGRARPRDSRVARHRALRRVADAAAGAQGPVSSTTSPRHRAS